MKRIYLSLLAVSAISSAQAAQPLALNQSTINDIRQQFALPVANKALALNINSLALVSEHRDAKQVAHVRMQQMYHGLPVIGGYAISHGQHQAHGLMQANPTDTHMTGKLYQGLATELGAPSADFKANAQKALEAFVASSNQEDTSEALVAPVVYIDANHQAHWAYKVSVLVRYHDRIPERPTAYVDAKTFKPLVQWNDIKTARVSAKAMGYGGNKKSGEVQYGRDLTLLEVTRDEALEVCYMENKETKVIDMEHGYSSKGSPMEFPCLTETDPMRYIFWTGKQADGYDLENGAYSPTNDALYSGYVIKHMYHDWYGVEALKKRDGSPMQLVMRVHYGQGYENAFWDGKQMTFGDGEDMMYPLVSLGVGAHEISHGFTEQHSSLEYYGQSGGMNEAFSDIAAMAAEYYSVGHSSWMIGAEIMKEDSGWEALRFMDKPSRDRRSIDTADDYYAGLDVHHSSGVYNRLFYLMSTHAGWNTRKAFDVMVKANMDYWTPYSDFDEGGCGILDATKDLGYPIDDVKVALKMVAINYLSCNG